MSDKAVQLTLPGFERARAEWRQGYQSQIGDDGVVRNRSGLEIKPLYTPEDWDGSGYLERLGFPGQAPYTRGIYPTMHRGRAWSQRQLIGLGTPEDYNERIRKLLDAGATAISFLPCNSGFRGLDCDAVDPAILGTCGTITNTVEDMEVVPYSLVYLRERDVTPAVMRVMAMIRQKMPGLRAAQPR